MLKRPEVLILRAGMALSLAFLLAIAAFAWFSPDLAEHLVAITVANVFLGRAAGMTLAYTFGFEHSAAMATNMVIESGLVLLFYPLFVFSLDQVPSNGWLRRVLDDTHAAAERHKDTVRRFGIPGLMVFVWSPFSMTGPVVGCAVGYLIGLGARLNIVTVLLSTYLAIICWGLLLGGIFGG